MDVSAWFLVCHARHHGLGLQVSEYLDQVMSDANQPQLGQSSRFATAKKSRESSILFYIPEHRLDLGFSFFEFGFPGFGLEFLFHFFASFG